MIEINVIQAALIGIFCYLGALTTPWLLGLTGGWYTLSRPLVAAFITGLIVGDLERAILIGVAVQTVYIAFVSPGNAMPQDLNFVSWLALPLAILSAQDAKVAVTLAATIGVAGTIIFNFTMLSNVFWNTRADKALAAGNKTSWQRNAVWFPQISNFIVRFVPVLLACRFGPKYIELLVNAMPASLMHVVSVFGGVLPAVGIAMLMRQAIIEKTMLIYFLFGFICVVFMKVNMIALVIISLLLALIHYKYKPSQQTASASPNDEDEF
ncbi:PTS system, fructose(mannose)-specific IIC [Sodalis praecaptivus]|uniref:PTS system, fructose(Mannose)-specific IIC n=1 Tax=Sodalis praecaptivus TaxID=1239307 RepID=W0I103_9GAMM|nr:PTS sugar transporter subunit IIC [Sodalis praecaptivus]AHF78128.1 PTS system, fructose(mannose)-specific IIC [Sodalis praecaptivus]